MMHTRNGELLSLMVLLTILNFGIYGCVPAIISPVPNVNTSVLVEKPVIFIEAGLWSLIYRSSFDLPKELSFTIDYPAVVLDRGSYIRLKEAEMLAHRKGLIESFIHIIISSSKTQFLLDWVFICRIFNLVIDRA